MSERIHSPATIPVSTSSASRWRVLLGGSIGLALVGAILFQVVRPDPAVSQTKDEPNKNSTAKPAELAARVNNQGIPLSAVADECVRRHGEEVLDTLINRLLIQQECDRLGITITDAEVKQEVTSIAKKFNLPIDTYYQMLQSERGMTADQYEREVIWPMLALKQLAGAEVKPSEDDIMKAFTRDFGPRVKARMILVEGNVRHANEIWAECQNNLDDFDRIARDKSADPNTRPLGGVIPPIRKYGGNAKVEEEAFKLKEGELSPVIQIADSRYVILKCEGTTEQVVTDPKEVWQELYAQVIEEKTQTSVAKIFEDIKARAKVHNLLTQTSTSGTGTASPRGSAAGAKSAATKDKVTPTSGTKQPGGVKSAAGEERRSSK